MPNVHWCINVDYQQIVDSNIANQIHGFTIDYGKFILMSNSCMWEVAKHKRSLKADLHGTTL